MKYSAHSNALNHGAMPQSTTTLNGRQTTGLSCSSVQRTHRKWAVDIWLCLHPQAVPTHTTHACIHANLAHTASQSNGQRDHRGVPAPHIKGCFRPANIAGACGQCNAPDKNLGQSKRFPTFPCPARYHCQTICTSNVPPLPPATCCHVRTTPWPSKNKQTSTDRNNTSSIPVPTTCS